MSQTADATATYTIDDLRHQLVAEGDVVGVRTNWDAIAVGIVDRLNDVEDPDPGDWLVTLRAPIVWDVSAEPPRTLDVDKGPPVGAEDWEGLGIVLGVGRDNPAFSYANDLVLNTPDPQYTDAGTISHYEPLLAGRVDKLVNRPGVEPADLLEGDEKAPPEVDA